MEKKTAKGLGLKSDEVCERKAPKKLQNKPAMEKKTASLKGFGLKSDEIPEKYRYQLDIYRFIEAIENH